MKSKPFQSPHRVLSDLASSFSNNKEPQNYSLNDVLFVNVLLELERKVLIKKLKQCGDLQETRSEIQLRTNL